MVVLVIRAEEEDATRKMSVIELELDEKEVEESHDHSETFFKCKAYIKHGDIVLSGDERIFDYDFE